MGYHPMWHLSFTMQPTLVSHSLHNSQLPSHVPSHKTLQGIQLLKHTLCSVHSFSALPTKGYWLSWHLGWQVIFRINSWTACYPQCTRWTTKGKMIIKRVSFKNVSCVCHWHFVDLAYILLALLVSLWVREVSRQQTKKIPLMIGTFFSLNRLCPTCS